MKFLGTYTSRFNRMHKFFWAFVQWPLQGPDGRSKNDAALVNTKNPKRPPATGAQSRFHRWLVQ
jgi:hypothetical protein